MKPMVVMVPLILVVSGVVTFLMVPLELPYRLALALMDLVAAIVIGIVLWRKHSG